MPRTCITCGVTKSLNRFRQLVPSKERTEECLACLTKKETEELNAELKEAKGVKEARKIHRQMEKHRARVRVTQGERDKKRRLKQIQADNAYAQEIARRTLARKSLLYFIQRFMPNYEPGWVHHDICQRLEKFLKDVEDKKDPRLMLFMPPRHGKSLIASHYFPAWALGHNPHFEIIASSYAVSLPLGFSRKVRRLVQDKNFKNIFNHSLHIDPEAKAAETWATLEGGGYVAAGVGGGITGKGAHILIIDDPVKDAQEADSEAQRDTVWDWWGTTAKTRLAPGGGALVIQTRWHDDDLSGRLIYQMETQLKELEELRDETRRSLEKAADPDDVEALKLELKTYESEIKEIDRWEIVKYPGIAEHDEFRTPAGKVYSGDEFRDAFGEKVYKQEIAKHKLGVKSMCLRQEGEALHSARFPIGRLRSMKRGMQPRHWSALYQQNPVPDTGDYFTKDMIRLHPIVPDWRDMYIFSAWDLAIGTKTRNDWCVGVVGALDHTDRLHIIDVIRAKFGDTHRIAEAIMDTWKTYNAYGNHMMVGVEKGQLELAVRPHLNRLMKERRVYPTFAEGKQALVPITDKEVRARPLQGRMQQGMVLFPENQPWLETVQHELLRFPGGKHDDIVDALAWLVRLVGDHKAPQVRQPKPQKSWKDRLRATSVQRHPMGA